ncbi:prepilin peptidase [Neobacillus sp. PS2-9]|uniref:A24 family peptidase n=1 Tax=Neobacillus sp. PS2-9 TaxID=3070676 RepID=UPI0027DED2C0|nr:prepilin peptidase [Neobacillus sp. PS2-9]WML57198.1 prepilin peptidase [Neobacillus sp. PS2-9]
MWSTYLLIILLIICVITDLKESKIYNAVLFPFLIIAWVFHIITGGWHGLTEALLGTAVGLGILLIPYLLGGMGAGDVKLLAVIGGIKGISFVLMASIYMALAGGIMAILFLFYRKGLLKRVIYLLHGLRHGIRLPLLEDSNSMKTTLPYGVAIAAGAIYQAYFPGVLFQ